jgi:hypothetical protein
VTTMKIAIFKKEGQGRIFGQVNPLEILQRADIRTGKFSEIIWTWHSTGTGTCKKSTCPRQSGREGCERRSYWIFRNSGFSIPSFPLSAGSSAAPCRRRVERRIFSGKATNKSCDFSKYR